jgi:hypothetical protein
MLLGWSTDEASKKESGKEMLRLGFRGTVRTLKSLCFAWRAEAPLPHPHCSNSKKEEEDGRPRSRSRCSETLAHADQSGS